MHLTHLGHVFINFHNGSYQWVDIQQFRLPGPGAAKSALAMLIGHDLYGDNHAGGKAGDDPQRHGPYWRDRITPDSFDPTDADTQEPLLRAWAEQYVALTADLHTDLDRELYRPLRAADRVYRLRDLGSTGYHDWGGVHSQFHELVLLDRAAGTLTVVVAADD